MEVRGCVCLATDPVCFLKKPWRENSGKKKREEVQEKSK